MKFKKVWILIILISCGYIAIPSLIKNYRLKKEGVYVLGKFQKKEQGVRGATTFTYSYEFNNVTYTRTFSGTTPSVTKVDTLIFIVLLKKDPIISRQVNDVVVPTCIGISDIPKDGWVKLPSIMCK